MGRVILALPMGSLNALRRGSAMTVFLLFALLSLLLLVLLVIIDFVLQANAFPARSRPSKFNPRNSMYEFPCRAFTLIIVQSSVPSGGQCRPLAAQRMLAGPSP